MNKFNFKFDKWIKILCIALIVLCSLIVLQSVAKLFAAKLAVDYFSNIFLIVLNLVVVFSVIKFIMTSSYNLADSKLIIKTAYFKDPVMYENIKKILYYVTEEELYLQLSGSENDDYVKINIKSGDFSKFVNALKQYIPDAPYEISLSLESEE